MVIGVCGHFEVSTGKEEEEGVVGRTISERPPTLHRCFHDQLCCPASSCCWDGTLCYLLP
jgi:hypothetical protein